VGSGSPTLYTPRADLVNAGSCGLGFSTAFEQEGGGPIFNIRLQTAAPLGIFGLPPETRSVLHLSPRMRIGEIQRRYKGIYRQARL